VRTTGAPPLVAADVLRVARTVACTEAEGPGRRSAVWVQGCTIRCPGCFNPHMWAAVGGTLVTVADWAPNLLAQAVEAQVEGVTLLGGEPFEQAAPLACLARAFRDAGLSVMTFTGYDYADLERWAADRPDIRALLDNTDLLADGPFLRDQVDRLRPWIGSTNQSLRPLTARYAEDLGRYRDKGEVTVSVSGGVAVNGWADVEALDALLHDLGRRGDTPRAMGRWPHGT
jgi:anaerobic ribonucleoside-triphosphate reductase activating protein